MFTIRLPASGVFKQIGKGGAGAELNGILAFIPDGGDDPNHIRSGLLRPNAGRQARLKEGATEERTLAAVTCTP